MMAEIEDAITKSRSDFHGWRRMNSRRRWEFLLGDGPPVHDDAHVNQQWGRMETSLYHFLTTAYKALRAHLRAVDS